ncbi:MAG: superoxide dismutase family protein [Myxococcota bacterium]
MLLALVLACAKQGGVDEPYAWEYEDRGTDEAEDKDEVARRDDATPRPPAPGATQVQPPTGVITRMATASLEPKGGSRVTGTVTFTETWQHPPMDMDPYPGRSDDAGGMGGDNLSPGSGPSGTTGDPGDAPSGTTAGTPSPGTPAPTGPSAGEPPAGMGTEGMDHHRMGHQGMGYGTVRVVIDLQNVPKGDHAIVIHEKGDCSGVDAASVGNRFDPLSQGGVAPGGQPGQMGDMQPGGTQPGGMGGQPQGTGRFAGDLGYVTADANGNAHKELTTAGFTLGAGGPRSIDGLAVVVHENRDDGTSPSGNVGKALACGVISAQVATK